MGPILESRNEVRPGSSSRVVSKFPSVAHRLITQMLLVVRVEWQEHKECIDGYKGILTSCGTVCVLNLY